jgi:type II secretion system protein G
MIHPHPHETAEQVTLDYASARRPQHFWRGVRFANVFFAVCVPVWFLALAAAFVMPTCCTGPPAHIALTRGKIGAMKTPIELYRQHVGVYPASLNDLLTPPASPASAARWAGPYITNLDDLKDAWNQPFGYKAPGIGNPKAYDLWSVGPDGVDGTKDDIGNWR